jgi:hypothetical protein
LEIARLKLKIEVGSKQNTHLIMPKEALGKNLTTALNLNFWHHYGNF